MLVITTAITTPTVVVMGVVMVFFLTAYRGDTGTGLLLATPITACWPLPSLPACWHAGLCAEHNSIGHNLNVCGEENRRNKSQAASCK